MSNTIICGMDAHDNTLSNRIGVNRETPDDANRSKDSDMVLKFLKEWWLGHINKKDRQYTSFLRKLMEISAF